MESGKDYVKEAVFQGYVTYAESAIQKKNDL